MELKQKKRPSQLLPHHAPPIGAHDDESAAGDHPAARAERSVFCQHSIHDGHFPVAGLTVREARRTLTSLLNIDPQAVAVIDGEIVDEDRVIQEGVGVLSFVKRSAVKG